MRTKGAVSYVEVKLSELSGKFNPDATIVVSRKFANANGIAGKPIVATKANIEAAQPVTVTEPVAVTEVVEAPTDAQPVAAAQAEDAAPVAITEVA